MSIAIFVPVYNDAGTLDSILSKVPKKINSYPVTLFVVDDGSQDESAEIARRFTSNVIKHETNRGVGAATKTGLQAICRFSEFDFIIKFDADGQHEVSLVSDVLTELEKGASIVICSRFHEKSDTSCAFIDRVLLNASAATWINEVTNWNITDARSGFMGFKFSHINNIVDDIITERYGIPIELLLRIRNLDPEVSVCEIPHPAMYGGNISLKLQTKYSSENINQKISRMEDAYTAFLKVLENLELNSRKNKRTYMV